MVNTGKPSQGCGTCRARRIKCDERKPTCFRCQKSKRECAGYRNQLFLRRLGGKSSSLSSGRGSSNGSLSITMISYRNSSSPEAVVLSPPTFGISLPIEEQALTHYITHFVLRPCKGNSRSYMDFVIPFIKEEKSLYSPRTSMTTAIMAVSLALLGNKHKTRSILPYAQREYLKALVQVNEALQDPERAFDDQTLAAVIILAQFEAITGTLTQLIGWSCHADGATMLVKMRTQRKQASPLGQVLHVMARSQLVVNCLATSTPPPLGVAWWTQLGTRDGLSCQFARLNLETAQLHAKANIILSEAVLSPNDADKIFEIAAAAGDLELKFQDWENALYPAGKFSSAWIYHIDEDQLEQSPCYPGRVDRYSDISIATAWNMMRASRIVLGADIVRISAWLLPKGSDYRITPEYIASAHTSKEVIEDIIASVPTFLGGVPVADGRRPKIERDGLGGQSALALFILWPLFIVTMSDHTTDKQRKWAFGRLHFIADEAGIHQAELFTLLNIRIPSMSIYKDQVAQEQGNDIAKMKCVELAISKLPPTLDCRKELQEVLAGLLGCK